MRIDILTVVPELLESPLSHSIVGRAIKKGLVEIHVQNIRKYGLGPRAAVDDYCYGGDAGMVMMIEPVERMIDELKAEREYDEVIYMSPDGERLDQGISNELSLKKNLILLCGHYKGIDHRIREHLVTREISVGDYGGQRRRDPGGTSGGLDRQADPRGADGRDLGPKRQLPGRSPLPSRLHPPRRLQRLESPGSPSERQPEADPGMAGRASPATHESTAPGAVGKS